MHCLDETSRNIHVNVSLIKKRSRVRERFVPSADQQTVLFV
jgi:hypothetical protein